MASNVLNTPLESCCMDPVTGFYRTGKCDTGPQDHGMHTVCVEMTDEFLQFAKDSGNDLITPAPNFGFSGLKEGDRWCVCMDTVKTAIAVGIKPKLILKSTHISVLEFIDLKQLEELSVVK